MFSLTIALITAFFLTVPTTLAQQQPEASPYGISLGGNVRISPHGGIHKQIWPEDFNKYAEQISLSGTVWVRQHIFWNLLQPESAVDWNNDYWQYQAQLIRSLNAHNLYVSIDIRATPCWASSIPQEILDEIDNNPTLTQAQKQREKTKACKMWPPNFSDDGRLSNWNNFIQRLTDETVAAGITIHAWEIENEIDAKEGFRELRGRYPRMFNNAAHRIKLRFQNQQPLYILPSSFANIKNIEWQDSVRFWLTRIVQESFDAINIHYYGPYRIRDGQADDLLSNQEVDQELLEVVDITNQIQGELGLNKPVWITETNLLAHPKGGVLGENLNPDYALQIPIRYQHLIETGIEKVFWHTESSNFWGPGILTAEFETEEGITYVRTYINDYQNIYCNYQSLTETFGPAISTSADVYCDGKVDILDLLHWRRGLTQHSSESDINSDGRTSVLDYLAVLREWLTL